MKTLRILFLGAALTMLVLSLMSACGDTGEETDPTDPLTNGGATDEARCKDGCDRVADCLDISNDFVLDCRQECEQSGYFEDDVLNCIETSECPDVINCGFSF